MSIAACAAATGRSPSFIGIDKAERLRLLRRSRRYNRRGEDWPALSPMIWVAPMPGAGKKKNAQVWAGRVHWEATIKALRGLSFEDQRGETGRARSIAGRHDHTLELAAQPYRSARWPPGSPRLYMVLSRARFAPSAAIFSEVMHERASPPAVYPMVIGRWSLPLVRSWPRSPTVDMNVVHRFDPRRHHRRQDRRRYRERVAQELGGISPNIICPTPISSGRQHGSKAALPMRPVLRRADPDAGPRGLHDQRCREVAKRAARRAGVRVRRPRRP